MMMRITLVTFIWNCHCYSSVFSMCYMSVMHCALCPVGDGGNDVSMIQAADVGVGIVGKVKYLTHL